MKNSKKIRPEEEFELDEYLKLDIDFLYGILARKFFPYSKDLVEEGKKIIGQIDEELFQKICVEMEFCKNKASFNYLDTKSLSVLLYENLESIEFQGSKIPKILLAVILVKIGLPRFCKC